MALRTEPTGAILDEGRCSMSFGATRRTGEPRTVGGRAPEFRAYRTVRVWSE
jgi:hypothetical protein